MPHMMKFARNAVRSLIAAAMLGGLAAPAMAGNDAAFFESVKGRWAGPGEIVAGKYKGTRFNCDLTGANIGEGMDIGGACRVGVFTQKMQATLSRNGKGYRGQFLDGAAGKGLDITSGRVSGNQAVMALMREQLKGAMTARISGKDKLSITIAVDVSGTKVPVIAMTLNRLDEAATASAD
jgi:uncharacterized protein (DUF2147 family)